MNPAKLSSNNPKYAENEHNLGGLHPHTKDVIQSDEFRHKTDINQARWPKLSQNDRDFA